MANHARGEAELVIAGKTYRIAMTMGSLAELAQALGVETMPEVGDRMGKMAVADMPVILRAVLRSNGYDVSDEDIAGSDPLQYATELIPAFFRTRGDKAAEPNGDARPPKRQKA